MFALPNPDYENHPKYIGFLDQVDDSSRRKALARFLPSFEACYSRYLTAPRRDFDVRIGAGDELLRQLQVTGCALTKIADERKSALSDLTWPAARTVRKALKYRPEARFKHTQFSFNREEHADVFEAAEQVLEHEHVFSAMSAYVGRPLGLSQITVQVNTDLMTAIDFGELDADGLPSPRTRYFHIDSALWPSVKVLIYLTRVTPDQGPFRYVEGSHRMASDFELMVRKVNDRENLGDSAFMALPAPFRMCTLFGDDIDPVSPEALQLLANERACDDGVSDLILFDHSGVHRGGFVRTGYRYMLQCHFTARD